MLCVNASRLEFFTPHDSPDAFNRTTACTLSDSSVWFHSALPCCGQYVPFWPFTRRHESRLCLVAVRVERDRLLAGKSAWTIHSCQKCGLAELFDAPSDLMRVVFPNVPEGAVMEAFTSFCPLCGGVQALEFRDAGDQNAQTPPRQKSWWQIWK